MIDNVLEKGQIDIVKETSSNPTEIDSDDSTLKDCKQDNKQISKLDIQIGSESKYLDFELCREELRNLKLKVIITKSAITLNIFQLYDKIIPMITFNNDHLYGVCLNSQTAQACSSHIELKDGDTIADIILTFSVNGNIENIPQLIDSTVTGDSILQKSSIDLMDDWLYCHEHHHSLPQKDTKHEVKDELKPTILSSLEQIVYLITLADSRKLLLESVQHKDLSIFIESNPKCLSVVEEDCHYSLIASDQKTSYTLLMQQQFPVYFKIFALNSTNPLKTTDNRILFDAKLLKTYRMSFDVEWFQIEQQLYESLTKQLIEVNELIKHLPLTVNLSNDLGYENIYDYNSEHDNKGNDGLSLLNMFKFY